MATIDCGLTDEEALRLATRHNTNGHFNHSMTHQDYVSTLPAYSKGGNIHTFTSIAGGGMQIPPVQNGEQTTVGPHTTPYTGVEEFMPVMLASFCE